MARRKLKPEYLLSLGNRLKNLFDGLPLTSVARRLDNIVTSKALGDYVTGKVMPRTDVLIKVSEVYKVSLDWLLTGQESFLNKDGGVKTEIERAIDTLASLGVAEEAREYLSFMVEKHSRTEQTPAQSIRKNITATLGLDTVGKRLRYLRESELELTPEAMAKEMDISPEKYKRIEKDEVFPPASALTVLHSNHPNTLDKDVLDWLLEG